MILCNILYFFFVFFLNANLFAAQDENLHILQNKILLEEKNYVGRCQDQVQDLLQCALQPENSEALTKKIKLLSALLPDDNILYVAGALHVNHVLLSVHDELLTCMRGLEQMHDYWHEQMHKAEQSYFLSNSYKEQISLKMHDLELVQNSVAQKLGNYLQISHQLQAVQSVQEIHNFFEKALHAFTLKHSLARENIHGHAVVQFIELLTADLLALRASIQDLTKNMHVPSHFERHKIEYAATAIGLSIALAVAYQYQDVLFQKVEQGSQAARDFFKNRIEKPLNNIYKLVWLQEKKGVPVPNFEPIVLQPSNSQDTSTPVFASWTWKDLGGGVSIPVAAVGVNDDELLNIARKSHEVQVVVGNINELQNSIEGMVPVINETKEKASLILEFMSLLPAAGLAYLGYKGVEKTYNALFLQPVAVKPFMKALRQLHTVCIKNMHERTVQHQADGYIWFYTAQIEKLLYALPQEKADQYKHDVAFLRSTQYSYEQKVQIAQRMLTLYTT